MQDKEQLIASIAATQRSLGRVFAGARANPLMELNLTMRQLKVLLTLFSILTFGTLSVAP